MERQSIHERQGIFVLATIAAFIAWLAPVAAWAQSVHYLGIAASNRQSVFSTEVGGAANTVAARFDVKSSRTIGRFGVVSLGAVHAAIRATAAEMDLQKDVLFLLVSSHGAPGRGVELSGGGLMSAGQLRAALDSAGIRNRVVVVSACYSGQFIGPLSGANSAVITAANATNPSFGCSNSRSYTYFGDAFFNYGLAQSGDLRRAFAVARREVTSWERADGQRPSNPQMTMGSRLAALLSRTQ